MTFTGGTTGRPKGALVSHRARFVSSWTTALEHEVSSADVVGVLTPLYHAMGMTIWLQAAMLAGATAVLLTGWDPDRFAEATARHRITNALMVPVQLRELLSERHFDPKALASLGKLGCGGAVTSPALVAEINGKLPNVLFTNHYGQSETGPLCLFKHHHPRERAGTIGQPAAGVALKIVDPEGEAVAPGAVGEIVTSGPYMMAGYYNDPEETANYFRGGDGWGWTGDLATIDEDGFVTLVGRSKDMIVTGGINVYPREVEIVLERHDAVAECTVFGVPDEKWGEALVAYVVCQNGAGATEAELVQFCERHLARFKRPRYVRFVAAIPKTPSGKIQKPKLREAFLKESGSRLRG
jgi:acyl-CoA synthetase (AMP-forming)/AMP-acid ligase II